MTKYIPKILVVFLLVAFSSYDAFSQLDDPLAPKKDTKKFFVGPIAGYNRVMHSTDRSTFQDGNIPCPKFENGSANGFFVGGSIEFLLGSAKNSKASIIGRAMYSTLPSFFEVQGEDLPTVINVQQSDGSYKPEQRITSINYLNDVSYNTLAFDVLVKYNVLPISDKLQLGVIAGPTVDLVMTSTEENRMTLVEPQNAQLVKQPQSVLDAKGWAYSADSRTLYFSKGDIPNSSSVRVGLKFGAQLEYNMEGLIIVPNVMYNFGLTNISSSIDWRVSALQIGVDVRFAI